MTSIIQSIPWTCEERNCPAGWHLANYWIDTTNGGYTVDRYGDGDHEDIEAEDIPTAEETTEAWSEYAQYVAKMGEDPLGEYTVSYYIPVIEHWRLEIHKSLSGPIVALASRNNRRVALQELPQRVRDYMHVTSGQNPTLLYLSIAWGELLDCSEITPHKRWPDIIAIAKFTLVHKKPRKDSAIRRDIIAAAKLPRVPLPLTPYPL